MNLDKMLERFVRNDLFSGMVLNLHHHLPLNPGEEGKLSEYFLVPTGKHGHLRVYDVHMKTSTVESQVPVPEELVWINTAHQDFIKEVAPQLFQKSSGRFYYGGIIRQEIGSDNGKVWKIYEAKQELK